MLIFFFLFLVVFKSRMCIASTTYCIALNQLFCITFMWFYSSQYDELRCGNVCYHIRLYLRTFVYANLLFDLRRLFACQVELVVVDLDLRVLICI